MIAQLPQPEAVWPVTVAGWVALLGSAAALATALWSLHRAGVLRARKEAHDEARVQRVEERCASDLNGFRVAVTQELNGFGQRIERLEQDEHSRDSVVNGLLQAMAESRVDRKHHGEALQRIEANMADMRREIQQVLKHRAS